jgi:hypothetical protein
MGAKSWEWARQQWMLSEGVGTVRTRSARGLDQAGDGWAPAVLIYSQIIQTGSNMEIENECLHCFKNSQISHTTRLGHYEQFSKLYRHPILNRIRVKNHRTNPPFEYLRNF